jgi:hypothetical protein
VNPSNVDGVLAAYAGTYLKKGTVADATELTNIAFEEIKYPQQILSLFSTISDGRNIPLFKTGDTPIANADGTVTYNNFGAGVMFILGLAYYSTGSGSIPTYVPLIFKFKLFAISRLDQDGDGILLFRRFEWRWIYEKFFEYKFYTQQLLAMPFAMQMILTETESLTFRCG